MLENLKKIEKIINSELASKVQQSVIINEELTVEINLNDLVDRMNIEKKKDQRTSILFSVSAISALIVFGIILTL